MGYKTTICLLLALWVIPWASACSSGDESAFKGGEIESKPRSSALVEKRNADIESAEVLGTYSYDILVTTQSGVEFYGTGKIEVLSDFSMRTSEGNVQIGSLKLDLRSLTNRLSLDFFKDKEQNITRDNGIIYVRDYALATFDPPRPLFIGPIVRNVDRFKNLKQTTQHTVTVKDGDNHGSGKGFFTLEVLETKGTFKSSRRSNAPTYSNVLHWQLSSRGFDQIPAEKILSFEKVEWWYSTAPLGVVKLAITGDLGDMLKQGKGLVGKVTITMEIADMKL